MITVTGATGNVGRPLTHALRRAGHTVTAVSRGRSSPLPAGHGVRPVVADLADPATLRPALEGADALFLLVSGAGAHVDGPRVLANAGEAGVRRVVLLSSQAVSTRPGSVSHAPLAALEEAVRNSGLEWTILRPGGFHSNAAAWAPGIRSGKTVFAPFGDVGLPSVDPRDIAEVAAACLVEGRHSGRTYTLTGPAATTPRERVEAIAGALGAPLSYVEVTRDQAREQMLQMMPEPVAEGTLSILAEPTPEEVAVSPDVERVLGRAPLSFRDWAEQHADLFR
ncbi:SDR family oxidoreductase [Streptomyces synnematoformans]|uniref:SDR family oxidoreductase n=1 Tax=Streptomyces synnematoformans TaxID=415721 RepID=UPI0031DE8E7B